MIESSFLFQNLQEVSGLEVTMDCQVDKSEDAGDKGASQVRSKRFLKKHDGKLTREWLLRTALSGL